MKVREVQSTWADGRRATLTTTEGEAVTTTTFAYDDAGRVTEERTTAQAAVDFCVYTTMTFTSLGSGALVTTGGWGAMNLG